MIKVIGTGYGGWLGNNVGNLRCFSSTIYRCYHYTSLSYNYCATSKVIKVVLFIRE